MSSRKLGRAISIAAMLGSLVVVASGWAGGSSPAAIASAQTKYGGIGATVLAFYAEHPQGAETQPVGVVNYRIDYKREGRAASYQVVVNPKSKLTRADLMRLLTRELPADAKQVQGWKRAPDTGWYCAIYRSSWLGGVLYGPYAVLYASAGNQQASAMVSTAPACRG